MKLNFTKEKQIEKIEQALKANLIKRKKFQKKNKKNNKVKK